LTWAEAAHESPYGRIAVSWRLDGDGFGLRVEVPAGTSAEVVLPNGRIEHATPGTHTFRSP
jgi:alpha-L-rhamnosidase